MKNSLKYTTNQKEQLKANSWHQSMFIISRREAHQLNQVTDQPRAAKANSGCQKTMPEDRSADSKTETNSMANKPASWNRQMDFLIITPSTIEIKASQLTISLILSQKIQSSSESIKRNRDVKRNPDDLDVRTHWKGNKRCKWVWCLVGSTSRHPARAQIE